MLTDRSHSAIYLCMQKVVHCVCSLFAYVKKDKHNKIINSHTLVVTFPGLWCLAYTKRVTIFVNLGYCASWFMAMVVVVGTPVSTKYKKGGKSGISIWPACCYCDESYIRWVNKRVYVLTGYNSLFPHITSNLSGLLTFLRSKVTDPTDVVLPLYNYT